MKKKRMTVCLAAVLACLLAACGGTGAADPSAEAESAAEEAAVSVSISEAPAEEASSEEAASGSEEAAAEEASSGSEEAAAEEAASGSEETPAEEASSGSEEAAADSASAASESASSEAAETAAPEDLAGVFKLVEMDRSGEITDREAIAALEEEGQIVYAELTPEGGVLLDLFEETIAGSWDENGIVLEGQPVDWSLGGDVLTLERNGTKMVFERTDAEYVASVKAIAEAAAKEETGREPVVIEDNILIDNENCYMEITGYDPYGWQGYTISVTCENRSKDKNMQFSIAGSAVNGYMLDPLWSAEVAAGSTVWEEIVYDTGELEFISAAEPDEIIWDLWVYDTDDVMADPFFDELVALYPTGKAPGEVVPADRLIGEREVTVVDNEDLAFIIYGIRLDSAGDYIVDAYIENRHAYPIMVAWDDTTVNGVKADPFWAAEVMAGKRAFEEIRFDGYDLAENEITDITEITFHMTAYNDDDWMADYLIDDTYFYRP